MNLLEELSVVHSKKRALEIANYVLTENKFDELMDIFFNAHYRINQRAAYILSLHYEKDQTTILPYVEAIVLNLKKPNLTDAVKRNTIRILQFIDIDEKLEGETYDICFNFLISKDEPIAIKAFSMRVLANICKNHPELKHELIPIIEDMIPYGSPGIKSRGKKILKELNSL